MSSQAEASRQLISPDIPKISRRQFIKAASATTLVSLFAAGGYLNNESDKYQEKINYLEDDPSARKSPTIEDSNDRRIIFLRKKQKKVDTLGTVSFATSLGGALIWGTKVRIEQTLKQNSSQKDESSLIDSL